MKEENGIRYYEEGEKIMSMTEWYNELTCSVNALAYDIDPLQDLVSILAEAVTEVDNEKLEQIADKYDSERLLIIHGVYIPENCALLL